MATFLNLTFDDPTPRRFILKHLLFLVGMFLLPITLFRLDLIFFPYLAYNSQLLRNLLPFFYLVTFGLLFYFQRKWYWRLALVSYPFLLFFWFLPKLAIRHGKVYVFLQYLYSLFLRLKNFKSTIFHLTLAFLCFIIFMSSSNAIAKTIVVCSISYMFVRYTWKAITRSLKMPFNIGSIQKALSPKDKIKSKPDWFTSFINRDVEKIESPAEKRALQLRRSAQIAFFLETLAEHMQGFKGKRAVIISTLLDFLFMMIVGLFFFTFINLELFQIDASSFSYSGPYVAWDFFRYSLSNFGAPNVDTLKPISPLAQGFEIFQWIYLIAIGLVKGISGFFTARRDHIYENMIAVTKLIRAENAKLARYAKREFGTDVMKAMYEIKSIQESLQKIKQILKGFF